MERCYLHLWWYYLLYLALITDECFPDEIHSLSFWTLLGNRLNRIKTVWTLLKSSGHYSNLLDTIEILLTVLKRSIQYWNYLDNYPDRIKIVRTPFRSNETVKTLDSAETVQKQSKLSIVQRQFLFNLNILWNHPVCVGLIYTVQTKLNNIFRTCNKFTFSNADGVFGPLLVQYSNYQWSVVLQGVSCNQSFYCTHVEWMLRNLCCSQ